MVAVGVLVANSAHLIHDLRLSCVRRQCRQSYLLSLVLLLLGGLVLLQQGLLVLLLVELGGGSRCEVLARQQQNLLMKEADDGDLGRRGIR